MPVLTTSPRFASTAAPFVPTDLANLTVWIDASDTASITSSGGAVSQINDKSGNAHHFTQATAGNKPTTGTVTLNSRNVLDFDGTDDLLVGPLFSTITDNFTMFVVVKPDAAPASDTVPFFLGAGASNGYGAALDTAFAGTNVGYLRGGVAWHDSTTATPTTGGHILTLRRTAGTWDMRLDRAATSAAGAAAPTAPTVGARIGSHEAAGGKLNGGFAEAIYYSAALSNTDRDTVETYLRDRWGTP